MTKPCARTLGALACLPVLIGQVVSAHESPEAAGTVEVVIQGKQYESIRAYKQEQLKRTLKRSLSAFDLSAFTEEELFEIMAEVRKTQGSDSLDVKAKRKKGMTGRKKVFRNNSRTKEDAKDMSVSQMQEMLNDYRKIHRGAGKVAVDPNKVKNIIISP